MKLIYALLITFMTSIVTFPCDKLIYLEDESNFLSPRDDDIKWCLERLKGGFTSESQCEFGGDSSKAEDLIICTLHPSCSGAGYEKWKFFIVEGKCYKQSL